MSVLTKYNKFRTQIGFIQQKRGLGMGIFLSPLQANLFVLLFEAAVIDKLKSKGDILQWRQYVDDYFALAKFRLFLQWLNHDVKKQY